MSKVQTLNPERVKLFFKIKQITVSKFKTLLFHPFGVYQQPDSFFYL